MKIETPKTLYEFNELFCKFKNQGFDYFRGQSDYSWQITSSIARNKGIKNIEDFLNTEKKIIDNLKNKIRVNNLFDLAPVISSSYHKSWNFMMLAQHFGFPTRLMDFSNEPQVGLQFAIDKNQNSDKDGALIIYHNPNSNHQFVEESTILKSNFDQTHHSFFFQGISYGYSFNNECYLAERRKLIQGSKFLYRDTNNLHKCLTLDDNFNENLTIIHIPFQLKSEINENYHFQDLYHGQNVIDRYSKITKTEYMKLNDGNVKKYLK